jgi:nitrilase
MAVTRIAAVAAHFGTGIARALDKITGIVDRLAADGVDLLVLPDATLGGYIGDLRNPDPATGPEAIDPEGPEIRLLCRLAGAMTICVGYAEHCDGTRYNAAVCLTGDGVLGRHRKVHQPAGEHLA